MYCICPFFRCCGAVVRVAAAVVCSAAANTAAAVAAAHCCCRGLPNWSFCCKLHKLLPCSAARGAPSCSTAATAAAESGQDNSLYALPLPRLELETTPLALANQQLSLLGKTWLTRPGQDSVAASLSRVRTLIHSSDEDLQQTGHIHPDCPCPPIAVLQPPATFSKTFWPKSKKVCSLLKQC